MQVAEQHKKGTCREKITSIKNSRVIVMFCDHCGHTAQVTESRMCMCCGLKITKKQKHESDLKKFEEILKVSMCAKIVREWIALPYDIDYAPGWCIKMGTKVYLVPIKFFAEFLELPDIEVDESCEDKYTEFIENVKKRSFVIGIAL